MYISRRLGGWNRFAGGSLVTFAAILVRLQAKREGGHFVFAFKKIHTVYDSRRLREWNRFAGGSLVTFASILVLPQAKREGGDCVLASFSKFMLCIFLASSAGKNVLVAAI